MACLLVRTDGGSSVGLGHIMRCCAIARAARTLGNDVIFAVASEESAAIVRKLGFDVEQVGEVRGGYSDAGAKELFSLVQEHGVGCVLVDSYAARPSFLSRVHAACRSMDVQLAYVDDVFRSDSGYLGRPQAYSVDAVVNYSFGFSEDDYGGIYGAEGVLLMIGPEFAPVREEFKNRDYWVRDKVERVLVTAGGANPGGALELLAKMSAEALPGADVVVVLGPSATFDESVFDWAGARRLDIHRNPSSMADLMLSSDLAVSAAGSTLYELACVGVPTVAVPVVDNQLVNSRGWAQMGLSAVGGLSGLGQHHFFSVVKTLSSDSERRWLASHRSRALVDGIGSQRIAERLMGVANLTS